MALALWAAAEAGPVAWVSLDDYDNQPGVFWAYVVAALRRSGAAVRGRCLPPRGGGRQTMRSCSRLASALAAQGPPVTLVIDDVHVLTEPAVLDELDFVLRNVGPGLRVVISARTDPLLPLHRYRLAGELAEIRAGDLAFSTAEAGLLMAQHGCTLSADSLECLTRRTEGWAAGLRLAAISMDTHPDPDQFVKELITEDSALTGYLVEEVLNTAPPEVREVLLATSILERVSAEAASELTGDEQAGAILPAVAHANAFVQPAGSGWYRYHTLFAEVLRLKLRHEHPDRMAALHRRAARWYERNGPLTDAVRHAARPATGSSPPAWSSTGWRSARSSSRGAAGPWPASSWACRTAMPGPGRSRTWSPLRPRWPLAGLNLLPPRWPPRTASLTRLPADQEIAARLAAAMIRLAASRRTGDLPAAAAAAARAEALVSRVPGGRPARHRQLRARVLSGRGAVELWSGHLDEAARILESAVAAATASGGEHERADCLGQLALVEALRGRLRRAAKLATRATAALTAGEQQPPAQHPAPAALVALAWVHLERGELREARSRLKQADAALGVSPDKLIGAVACLAVARGYLAEDAAKAAMQMVARARSGWSVPAWLDQRLSLAESRACAAAGDIRGRARRSRAGRPRYLAGGGGHARARLGRWRRRRESKARARARAGGRQRGARTGAPAGVAG